ncbi:MAG TPA: redoxin family protein [Polyangiaceae bacterium]|nr:redoxin family protein [Polyangiaceae bacterium]
MISCGWAPRFLAIVLLAACSRTRADPAAVTSQPGPMAPAPAGSATSRTAEVGNTAPDFVLKDLDGHEVRLSDSRGKVTVLEWFNPQCPFVNLSHTKGSLKGAAARHTAEGVVWLGIDSAAPGKQGYDPEAIRAAVSRFGISHPILRDETGAVGHAYGASNTPHMFVIDRSGTLVYAGAIDNSPDAEGQSPQGGSLINYVDAALADLAAGQPVRTPRTKPYGCGVKYGS